MGHDAGVASPLPALLLVILGACAVPRTPEPVVPRPPANPDVQADAASVARGLLRAQPADWAAHMEAAWSAGERIVAPLVDGLQQDPEAPGGQPAVRLLGMFGGKVAIQFLETHLRERGRNATEAALALGEADARAAVPLLRETAVDRLADPTLRCACTAGLVRLGAGRDVRTLVRAFVLAGTPAGEPLRLELGLPQRSRWALERHMLQRALLAASGNDFGFDTDSPWPDLERAAEAIDAFLTAPANPR